MRVRDLTVVVMVASVVARADYAVVGSNIGSGSYVGGKGNNEAYFRNYTKTNPEKKNLVNAFDKGVESVASTSEVAISTAVPVYSNTKSFSEDKSTHSESLVISQLAEKALTPSSTIQTSSSFLNPETAIVSKSRATKTIQVPVVTITGTPKERVETVQVTKWITHTVFPSSTATFSPTVTAYGHEPTITTFVAALTSAKPELNDDYYKQQYKYLESKMKELYSSLRNDVPTSKKIVEQSTTFTESTSTTTTSFTTSASAFQRPEVSKLQVPESTIQNPTVHGAVEHGAGAKDILNMKPLPYKVSVSPQFQNHKPIVNAPNRYAKPKIHYNFGPEEIVKPISSRSVTRSTSSAGPTSTISSSTKSPSTNSPTEDYESKYESMFQNKPDKNEMEIFQKLYPEMERLFRGVGPDRLSNGFQAATRKTEENPLGTTTRTSIVSSFSSITSYSTSSSTSTIPEASSSPMYVYEDDNYVYEYVYADEVDDKKTGPLDLLHVPKENENSPFKTFKSKQDLNESYRKEQDLNESHRKDQDSNEPNTKEQKVTKPNSKTPDFNDVSREYTSNRPRKQHNDKHKGHKNPHKFTFDLFGFRSSSHKVQITWFLVALSLMPAYL